MVKKEACCPKTKDSERLQEKKKRKKKPCATLEAEVNGVWRQTGLKTPWAHPWSSRWLPELSTRQKGGPLKPRAERLHRALCPAQPARLIPLKSALNTLTAWTHTVEFCQHTTDPRRIIANELTLLFFICESTKNKLETSTRVKLKLPLVQNWIKIRMTHTN